MDEGLKFAVVLLAASGEDAGIAIEERLAFFKRQCFLDARHSLFVYKLRTMQPADFLQQYGGGECDVRSWFLTSTLFPLHNRGSLERSLFESAVNYYREHGKRVKRKRAKLPTGVKTIPTSALSVQGWLLRYEYKMATFAELMQENELATRYEAGVDRKRSEHLLLHACTHSRRHYIMAYNMLMELFKESVSRDTAVTNRVVLYSPKWTEMMVLADSMSFKVRQGDQR